MVAAGVFDAGERLELIEGALGRGLELPRQGEGPCD
jgi:hypothetical protein